MRWRPFFINGIILTLSALGLRYAGIWFNVFVTGQIGADGMGLYQLALSVYSLAATFATSGMSISVTRLLSENGPRSVRAVLKSGVGIGLLLSLVAAVALYFGAEPVATLWLADSRAASSLRLFSFALVAISISGCLNGYFLASRRIARSTIVQVFEQVVRIAATLITVQITQPVDVEQACCAVAAGSVVAEYASMLAGLGIYLASRAIDRKKGNLARQDAGGYTGKLVHIMLPVAASAYVRAGLRTVENLLTPWGLRQYGQSRTEALAQYGILKAMVMPIIYFPGTIISSFATLLIPELAESATKQRAESLAGIVRRVFCATLCYSIFCAAAMGFFAEPLCMLVYQDHGMAGLLRAMSALVPLMYLDNVTDAMLNALNQQVSALKINTLDSIARLGLMALLMPKFGLAGYIGVLFFSTVLNATLSVRRLLKVTGVRIEISLWVVRPVLAAASAIGLTAILGTFVAFVGLWGLVLQILIAVALYLLFIRLFGVRSGNANERSLIKTLMRAA